MARWDLTMRHELVNASLEEKKTQTRRLIPASWWRCLDPNDAEDRARAAWTRLEAYHARMEELSRARDAEYRATERDFKARPCTVADPCDDHLLGGAPKGEEASRG